MVRGLSLVMWCFWLSLALCGVMACASFVPAVVPAQQPEAKPTPSATTTSAHSDPSQALKDTLRSGWELYSKHQDGPAQEKLQQALAMAREEKSAWAEGEADRILGLVALRATKYSEAEAEFNQALALFESVPAPASIAHTHGHLGAVKNYLGKPNEALELYRKALSEFEELHDSRDEALVLENFAFIDILSASERDAAMERGLKLARDVGDKKLEASFLHHIGDRMFSAGNFAGASKS